MCIANLIIFSTLEVSKNVAFWSLAIAEQAQSGLSVRAFCEREGLSPASFYLWRRNLAQQATAVSSDEASEFVEVITLAGSSVVAPSPAKHACQDVVFELF
jgi:transposase-like protein